MNAGRTTAWVAAWSARARAPPVAPAARAPSGREPARTGTWLRLGFDFRLRRRLGRRFGADLLLGNRFVHHLRRRRQRRQLDLQGIGTQFRISVAVRDRLDVFRIRLIAVECKTLRRLSRWSARGVRKACGRFVRWKSWPPRPAARIRNARCRESAPASESRDRPIPLSMNTRQARVRRPLSRLLGA